MRPGFAAAAVLWHKNFNPRTPCGVRQTDVGHPIQFRRISIHAPLAGCDSALLAQSEKQKNFNPRTPCGVRPSRSCSRPSTTATFQSTHPLRGATAGTGFEPIAQGHFNPRTPCGVRLNISMIIASAVMYFNPRTPCGVRQKIQNHKDSAKYFNPRTPCGVRRCIHFDKFQPQTISIHAPLAGCDPRRKLLCNNKTVFQSTHPLRGATAKMHKIFCAFCDNRQFYRVSPSGVPSVGALFTYSRGLQRAGAGANLPVNGCALGLRAKSSASPQAGRSACSRSVRFYSRTSCRGNKTAGCRVPDP